MTERNLTTPEGIRSFMNEAGEHFRQVFVLSPDLTIGEVVKHVCGDRDYFKPESMEAEHNDFIDLALFVQGLNALGDPKWKSDEYDSALFYDGLMMLRYGGPDAFTLD